MVAGENGEDVTSNLHTIHLGELVRKGFCRKRFESSKSTLEKSLDFSQKAVT